MDFSSHLKRIGESVQKALHCPKVEMLAKLEQNLEKSRQILKVDSFNFWLLQIRATPVKEIPTTIFGVGMARQRLNPLPDSRSSLETALTSTCEAALTYCAEDDMCEAQSVYHYYVHAPTNIVFKVSELGLSQNKPSWQLLPSDIRIAKISELTIILTDLYQ